MISNLCDLKMHNHLTGQHQPILIMGGSVVHSLVLFFIIIHIIIKAWASWMTTYNLLGTLAVDYDKGDYKS